MYTLNIHICIVIQYIDTLSPPPRYPDLHRYWILINSFTPYLSRYTYDIYNSWSMDTVLIHYTWFTIYGLYIDIGYYSHIVFTHITTYIVYYSHIVFTHITTYIGYYSHIVFTHITTYIVILLLKGM